MIVEPTQALVITEDVIKRWKIKYPQGIFKLSLADFEGYVRLPTDKEMIKFCSKSEKNISDGKQRLDFFKMLWLGGDRKIIEMPEIFDQTEDVLLRLIVVKEKQMNIKHGYIHAYIANT